MEASPLMMVTVAGVVLSLWGVMFGYVINRIMKVEDKQGIIDCANTSIQTQLSQIQADLVWIKLELQKK